MEVSGHLYPRGKVPLYPLNRGMNDPRGRPVDFEEAKDVLLPLGIETWFLDRSTFSLTRRMYVFHKFSATYVSI
jgi:hypothetical protein